MAPSTSRCPPISRKHADILRALYHLRGEQRTALLRKADPALVRRICECALNLLCGSVPLSKKQKSRLHKHAVSMRKLVDPHKNLVSKKRIILQTGSGFLPALLAPLIGTVLASLVTS